MNNKVLTGIIMMGLFSLSLAYGPGGNDGYGMPGEGGQFQRQGVMYNHHYREQTHHRTPMIDIFSELDLSKEQIRAMKKLKDDYAEKKLPVKNRLRRAQEDLRDELDGTTIDSGRVDGLKKDIIDMQRQMLDMHVQQIEDHRKILSDEQIEKLAEVKEKLRKQRHEYRRDKKSYKFWK